MTREDLRMVRCGLEDLRQAGLALPEGSRNSTLSRFFSFSNFLIEVILLFVLLEHVSKASELALLAEEILNWLRFTGNYCATSSTAEILKLEKREGCPSSRLGKVSFP